MTDVALDLLQPDEAMADYISLFYDFRCDRAEFADVERADLAQIRFVLSGYGHGRFADGTTQQTTRVFVLGPTTGPLAITLYGPVLVFGMTLLPAGWAALVGVDASLMTNRIIDANEIYGPDIFMLADLLATAPDLAARVAIFRDFAMKRIARQDVRETNFAARVDKWLQSDFAPDVEELVVACGQSRRQVERNCKRLYGVPPRQLARKYRALRAAIAIARGASIEDCIGDGFYDQSHMIREIKQFTGTTPGAFSENLSVMARLTLENTDHIDRMAIVPAG
jgi:AraC-like DNA-binding protein